MGLDDFEIVDLTPVDNYVREMRARLSRREFFKSNTDALRAMNRDQLLRLASALSFMVDEYACLYDSRSGSKKG